MNARQILVDTGPLVAILYERDENHEQCVTQSKELPETLYTCWPVITEAAYLLRTSRRGVATLLSLIERRRLEILQLGSEDIVSITAILNRYHDQKFDFADACLMLLADREGIDQIFTLDHRHFTIFRTSSGKALDILPSPGTVPQP